MFTKKKSLSGILQKKNSSMYHTHRMKYVRTTFNLYNKWYETYKCKHETLCYLNNHKHLFRNIIKYDVSTYTFHNIYCKVECRTDVLHPMSMIH